VQLYKPTGIKLSGDSVYKKVSESASFLTELFQLQKVDVFWCTAWARVKGQQR